MFQESPAPSLQTPQLIDHDNHAFPGENWFLYWKLGPGLWRAKLEEYSHPGPIIVPINWSFHTDTGESFDFAQHRPETNLKKLLEEANQVGRTLAFFLPTTPVPYLPNGGVPHLSVGALAQNEQGLAYVILDGENNINKIYSFFDTGVFQAYACFTRELGRYFVRSGIDAHVWGMECGYSKDGEFKSFLSDISPTWQKSFDQFVCTQEQESSAPPPLQKQLQHDFCELIRQTYRQQAAKNMGVHWQGMVDVSFIDGGSDRIFEKLEEEHSPHRYLEQTLEALTVGDIPSSILVHPKQKKGCWDKMMEDIIINGANRKFSNRNSLDEWDNTLKPLRFFEIHHSSHASGHNIPSWKELRLKDYLQEYYRWTYKENQQFSIEERDAEPDNDFIYFLQGCDLTNAKFRQIIRLLMNGCHCVLDKSGITKELSRRLELFYMENDLNIERINLHTDIQHVQLQKSRLITFEGTRLATLSPDKIHDFWHRLIGVFSLRHLDMRSYPEIEYYWRTRLPSPEELNYEEIRRLSIYNSGSIKTKIDIPLPGNFKILRVIDQIHGNVHSSSQHITLELGPEGSLSLDFGVFS